MQCELLSQIGHVFYGLEMVLQHVRLPMSGSNLSRLFTLPPIYVLHMYDVFCVCACVRACVHACVRACVPVDIYMWVDMSCLL